MKCFLFAAISVLMLSACGSSQNNYHYPGYSMSGIYKACASVASGYALTLLTFEQANFTTSTTVYADQGCTGALVSSTSGSGTYSTSGNQINYSFSDGTVVYDIYRIADHVLLVGDRSGTNNGTTPALRPMAYSSSTIYYEVYTDRNGYYYDHYPYTEGQYAY